MLTVRASNSGKKTLSNHSKQRYNFARLHNLKNSDIWKFSVCKISCLATYAYYTDNDTREKKSHCICPIAICMSCDSSFLPVNLQTHTIVIMTSTKPGVGLRLTNFTLAHKDSITPPYFFTHTESTNEVGWQPPFQLSLSLWPERTLSQTLHRRRHNKAIESRGAEWKVFAKSH